MGDDIREAAKRAYGVLWREAAGGEFSSAARLILLKSITKAEQMEGIAWAIKQYGPITGLEDSLDAKE